MTAFKIQFLDKKHSKNDFACGIPELDRFLKEQASQHMKKRITTTYVLTEDSDLVIKGYYSLSSYSVNINNLPKSITKQFPKYPMVPATMLGRLAVATECQGFGIGEYLLVSALKTSYEISQHQGSLCVCVDAINQSAVNFYKKYGFIEFEDNNKKLFISMKTISNLFI